MRNLVLVTLVISVLMLVLLRSRHHRRSQGFMAGGAPAIGGLFMSNLSNMINEQVSGFGGVSANNPNLKVDVKQIQKVADTHAKDYLENRNPKSCSASSWTDCPETGCCYEGKCRISEICYGYRVNAKEEAKRDRRGYTRCTASGYDQCPDTGCCYEGVCSEARICYGDKAPPKERTLIGDLINKINGPQKSGPVYGAPGSMSNGQGPCTKSSGNGQISECQSGCCFQGVCQPRQKCFG